MAKKRRRRKKSGSSSGGDMSSMALSPGEVPTDEELEAEVASLDEKLTKAAQKKYDEAKRESGKLGGNA
jgi:hypothetical protein